MENPPKPNVNKRNVNGNKLFPSRFNTEVLVMALSNSIPMAQLGRDAMAAYNKVNGTNGGMHYVNKTPKYVSIKIDETHLSPDKW